MQYNGIFELFGVDGLTGDKGSVHLQSCFFAPESVQKLKEFYLCVKSICNGMLQNMKYSALGTIFNIHAVIKKE